MHLQIVGWASPTRGISRAHVLWQWLRWRSEITRSVEIFAELAAFARNRY